MLCDVVQKFFLLQSFENRFVIQWDDRSPSPWSSLQLKSPEQTHPHLNNDLRSIYPNWPRHRCPDWNERQEKIQWTKQKERHGFTCLSTKITSSRMRRHFSFGHNIFTRELESSFSFDNALPMLPKLYFKCVRSSPQRPGSQGIFLHQHSSVHLSQGWARKALPCQYLQSVRTNRSMVRQQNSHQRQSWPEESNWSCDPYRQVRSSLVTLHWLLSFSHYSF
jgi:hypothetical protein